MCDLEIANSVILMGFCEKSREFIEENADAFWNAMDARCRTGDFFTKSS